MPLGKKRSWKVTLESNYASGKEKILRRQKNKETEGDREIE
jgi:hypothetical protein